MVTMGYVWDRTTEFLGDNLALLMPIVILGLFVPTSISGSLDELRQGGGPGLKLSLGILGLALAILSLWVQLAIAALALDPALGRHMTRVATARLLPAIGVYLVLLVALGLLCLPLGLLLPAGGVDLAAMRTGRLPAPAAGYGVALLLYASALAVTVLAVGARLMPLTGVIVAERRGPGALTRAFRMSRGLTWRLIGVVVLYVVVATISALAAQTVFGSILTIFAGGDGPVTVARVITAIVVAAVSTGFTVLAAAFTAKLYLAIVNASAPMRAPAADGNAAAV